MKIWFLPMQSIPVIPFGQTSSRNWHPGTRRFQFIMLSLLLEVWIFSREFCVWRICSQPHVNQPNQSLLMAIVHCRLPDSFQCWLSNSSGNGSCVRNFTHIRKLTPTWLQQSIITSGLSSSWNIVPTFMSDQNVFVCGPENYLTSCTKTKVNSGCNRGDVRVTL